jgi:hypothetical protein
MLLVGFFPNPCVLIGLGANYYVHPALPCEKNPKLIYNINEHIVVVDIFLIL